MHNIYVEALKCKIFDLFKEIVQYLIAPLIGVISYILNIIGIKGTALKYALQAHRISFDRFSFKVVDNNLKNKDSLKNISSMIASPPISKEVANRLLIIRWPTFDGNKILSKGIIIITFTRTFAFFHKYIDIQKLETFFHIVLEPSWSGYFDPDILFWNMNTKYPIFVQSSEILDRTSIQSLGGNLIPISIGASDWVDHGIFYPTNEQRKFDSVYVANTSRGKRVNHYLKSLFEIKKQGFKDYKGALVCASWGGRIEEIKQLFKYYKMDTNCELLFNLNREDLRKILCQSKVNILLSKKEGSNRSLFESMFCDTPVLALVDNLGVNKSYINEFTGVLAWDHHLAKTLLTMRNKWMYFRPREWAMKNISPEVTTEKLCSVIANFTGDKFLEQSLATNEAVFVKVNRPEIEYFHFPGFDKLNFNSKFIDIFLISNDSIDIESKLKNLIKDFEKEINRCKTTN